MKYFDGRKIDVKVLHVVGGLNRAGVETWLVRLLPHLGFNLRFDFLVDAPGRFDYSDEVEQYGCKILCCARSSRPDLYARNFWRILKEHGPYHCIHSHVHHFGAYPLFLAKLHGIPIRICHSHIDTRAIDNHALFARRFYLRGTRQLINRCATHRLAVSAEAGQCLFDGEFTLLPCGIPKTTFSHPDDRENIRLRYDIPETAFVVGHVGRFETQKNHRFILEVAKEIVRLSSDSFVVLVGSGLLKDEMQRLAVRLGIAHRVIFAGVSSEVPLLMSGLFDVLLFPSLYEGLGMVAIEAQAAGLPCVISNAVPASADVIPSLVRRLPLSMSASEWAFQVCEMKHRRLNPQISDERFRPYLLESSARAIQAVYAS
jgi:glycosyltransferase involved in cell wall biosynthesis